VQSSDEDATIRREEIQHRRRLELRSLAKILAENAGHDYRLIHAAFEAVDAGKDGWISAAAFEAVFVRFGAASDIASRTFSLLERNNDDCVNYKSFMARCGTLLQHGLRAQPRFQPPSVGASQNDSVGGHMAGAHGD